MFLRLRAHWTCTSSICSSYMSGLVAWWLMALIKTTIRSGARAQPTSPATEAIGSTHATGSMGAIYLWRFSLSLSLPLVFSLASWITSMTLPRQGKTGVGWGRASMAGHSSAPAAMHGGTYGSGNLQMKLAAWPQDVLSWHACCVPHACVGAEVCALQLLASGRGQLACCVYL